MDAPRLVLLVFVFIFLLSAPDSQRPTPNQRRELHYITHDERDALSLLSNAHYGDLDSAKNKWINVTGFREQDGYAWHLLPLVQARVREQAEAVLHAYSVRSGKNMVVNLEDKALGLRYSNSATVETLDGAGPESNFNDVAVPFFQNITGLVHGRWARSSIISPHPPPVLNLTAMSPIPYMTHEYDRNITGPGGEISLRLDEKRGDLIKLGRNSAREIKAELTIQDQSSSGDGWDLTLHGVHFPESGSVVLSTTSDRFGGIFALPHFARSESAFEASRQLLNGTIMNAILRQERAVALPSYPWASTPNSPAEAMFPTPHCEYIVYLQQHFVWPYSSTSTLGPRLAHPSYLEEIEYELRHPTGRKIDYVPELHMPTVIFSPDCGFVLESAGPPNFPSRDGRHMSGPKAETYYQMVRHLVELFFFMIAGQVYLLVRQMRDASTPSTRSRISYYTVAIMGLGDGFICLSSMALGVFMESVFLTITATSFLAFLCVAFFGMKFLMDLWNVQAPERLERERVQRLARQEAQSTQHSHQTGATAAASTLSIPTVTITAAGAETLPLPVTAPRPVDTGATPIILPPDQDIEADAAENATGPGVQNNNQTTENTARREMGAVYTKFYLLLIAILFISLHATTWPLVLRSLYANALSILYLSFWIPQTKRNIIRNCRKALRWEFVLGQSVLRLMPFVYFYAFEGNIMFAKPDRYTLYALIGWVWLQVWVLASQEILGPRFFVPSGWAPPAYDYHPILRENDEESGAMMPIGLTQATTEGEGLANAPAESKERGKKTFDCAICMQNIEVPVIPTNGAEGEASNGASLGAGLFSRRVYMVTPCRHIFHSICLESWMRYKLQCPICRDSLPPL